MDLEGLIGSLDLSLRNGFCQLCYFVSFSSSPATAGQHLLAPSLTLASLPHKPNNGPEINELIGLLRVLDSDLTSDEEELFMQNFENYRRFVRDATNYSLEGASVLPPRSSAFHKESGSMQPASQPANQPANHQA